ncbi:MAG: hypothetical protein OSA04_07235 [Flavobacteriales bacterium]|nr:hypothetical protein [Flavobacteriales bacterium]
MAKKKHKKRSVRTKKRPNSRIYHGLGALFIFGALYFGYTYYNSHFVTPWQSSSDKAGFASVVDNYSEDVQTAAAAFNLPYPYLMALIQLECSGIKPAGERFEPHVFRRLQAVRDGKRKNYENITQSHLANASDAALKNLATSWGPFQLMGYKCILLDVQIRDIRGDRGVYHGVNWINITYGDRLRRGEYKNCFHMHNTGRTYPRVGMPTTHDPQYVPRGLAGISRYQLKSETNNAR